MSIDNKRYRFKIINSCDIVERYTATNIVNGYDITAIVLPGHNLNVGDWVSLTGFAPSSANRTALVLEGTPLDPGIGIDLIPNIDTDVYGTVNKLAGERIVTPLNFHESEFEWNQEQEEIFFRKLFNSPLKFSGTDFNYFRDYILPNECCSVKFIIEKKCEGEWVTEWEGMFAHNSCFWDLDHCTVEVNFDLDDFYRCLLYGWEDEQTIFETVTYFERLECCEDRSLAVAGGGSCIAPCDGLIDALIDEGTDPPTFDDRQIVDPCDESPRGEWQLEFTKAEQLSFTNDPFELFSICTGWIREVAITSDAGGLPVAPAGTGWTLRSAVNYNGLPAHKWTRFPYGGIYYTFSDYTFTLDCDGDTPCFRRWDVNFPDTIETTDAQKSLLEVAETLIAGSCASIAGIRSDFFELNTPGDTPGFVSGTNYVTGAASKITNLRLIQVSSFLTFISGSVEEIVSTMTLKELLDDLKTIFNCKWFIDADGYLRIEHISWFQRAVGIDTTVGSDNIFRNRGKRQFKYDRQEIPLKEKFIFVYQGYKDFIGTDIKYDSPCVNAKKTVTYSVTKFSTDVQTLRDNSDTVKDFNSFVLLACDTDNSILSEVGAITGESRQNAHLGWANLHENYHKHNRYLGEGFMNDALTTFLSVRKTKRQIPITTIQCCEDIDPMTDLVKTELGDGQVDKMKKDNRDELFTIELLY